MAPNPINNTTSTATFDATKTTDTSPSNTISFSDVSPDTTTPNANVTTGRMIKQPEVARRGKHAGGYGTPGAFGKSKFKW
jgi:hypothetical protein